MITIDSGMREPMEVRMVKLQNLLEANDTFGI
jgi:hypothetical protein